MKKVLFMMLVIVAIATACDKTERTLKKIYGEYTIKNYTVDGVDSLSLYMDSLGCAFHFGYDDYDRKEMLSLSGQRTDGKTTTLYYEWILINNDNAISLNPLNHGVYGTGPFGAGRTSEWTIIDLGKNNLIMQTTYNGKQYNIELRK